MNDKCLIKINNCEEYGCRFETFSIEAGGGCPFDAVSVYNGDVIDPTNLIGRYCGQVAPQPVRSVGNKMLVNFRTDDSVAMEGFSAVYSQIYGEALVRIIVSFE